MSEVLLDKFPSPWRIIDTGSSFRIEDANKRPIAYTYYRNDGKLGDMYLPKEDARFMAQSIARLSRTA